MPRLDTQHLLDILVQPKLASPMLSTVIAARKENTPKNSGFVVKGISHPSNSGNLDISAIVSEITKKVQAENEGKLTKLCEEMQAEHEAKLTKLQEEMQAKLGGMQTKLTNVVEEMQAEHKAKLTKLQEEMQAKLAGMQTNMTNVWEEMQAENEGKLAEMQTENEAKLAKIRAKNRSLTVRLSDHNHALSELQRVRLFPYLVLFKTKCI